MILNRIYGVVVVLIALDISEYVRCENLIATELEDLSLAYLQWHHQKYFKNVTLQHDSPGTSNQTIPVFPNCQAFISEFSKCSSEFIRCSVDNARPFRFCEQCVVHFKKADTVYNDINHNDETMDDCRMKLLNSDRVQIINSVHQDITRIWNSAYCYKCFESKPSEDKNGTVHYQLSETTKHFLTLYKNFTLCIPTNISQRVHNETVCRDCRSYYHEMNVLFNRLLNVESDDGTPMHVCMDIVDMMNYTRLMWGNEFKCSDVNREYGLVVAVTCILLSIPVIFYIGMAVYGTRKRKELMQPKRFSIFPTPDQTYGSYDCQSLSDDQRISASTESSLQNSIEQTPQFTSSIDPDLVGNTNMAQVNHNTNTDVVQENPNTAVLQTVNLSKDENVLMNRSSPNSNIS